MWSWSGVMWSMVELHAADSCGQKFCVVNDVIKDAPLFVVSEINWQDWCG